MTFFKINMYIYVMKGNVGEKLRFDHPRNRSTMKKHLVH